MVATQRGVKVRKELNTDSSLKTSNTLTIKRIYAAFCSLNITGIRPCSFLRASTTESMTTCTVGSRTRYFYIPAEQTLLSGRGAETVLVTLVLSMWTEQKKKVAILSNPCVHTWHAIKLQGKWETEAVCHCHLLQSPIQRLTLLIFPDLMGSGCIMPPSLPDQPVTY